MRRSRIEVYVPSSSVCEASSWSVLDKLIESRASLSARRRSRTLQGAPGRSSARGAPDEAVAQGLADGARSCLTYGSQRGPKAGLTSSLRSRSHSRIEKRGRADRRRHFCVLAGKWTAWRGAGSFINSSLDPAHHSRAVPLILSTRRPPHAARMRGTGYALSHCPIDNRLECRQKFTLLL